MDKQDILRTEAMELLEEAALRLRLYGMHCTITRVILPHGMCISLHVGTTVDALAAASLETGSGGEIAHASGTSEQFAQMVTQATVDDASHAERLSTATGLDPALADRVARSQQPFVQIISVNRNSAYPLCGD